MDQHGQNIAFSFNVLIELAEVKNGQSGCLIIKKAEIMTDPPRQIFSIISNGLIAVFIVSIIFDERLPDRILGINTILWQIGLLAAAYLVRMGWKIVEWFRRRD